MTEAYWASASEKDEIVDFIDAVFSRAHEPHDFEALLPKLYGEQGDGAAHHFVVREAGRVAATVLAYPMTLHIGGRTLTMLGVGSVSTHPKMRGQGMMRLLMEAVDGRAKEMGAAFAVLSGQRQRYQYFGYDWGGYQLRARLTPDNVRHAWGDVDVHGLCAAPMTQAYVPQAERLMARQPCFCARSASAWVEILQSWNSTPFALLRHGEPIGFGTWRPQDGRVDELLLECEADFPAAMKLLVRQGGALSLCAAPWQRERVKCLGAVSEEACLEPNNMFKLYRREQVEAACAALDGFLPMALPLWIAPPDCV